MEISLLRLMHTYGKRTENTCYCEITPDHFATSIIEIKEGFFFLLVTNGTAQLTNENHTYELHPHHLAALTPSTKSILLHTSSDFQLTALYMNPSYFDSLPDGQPLYEQLARYLGHSQLPVFPLENQQTHYLKTTLSLFSQWQEDSSIYQDNLLRHLCCFILLQLADISGKANHDMPDCVKRSTEIFRLFKKTLMGNYRKRHDITFYAENLHISTTYLSRIVKKITGHTVHFHISELLCADARKLLDCTDLDVKEIAEQLGFSDQSVFGKFFMRKTGFSPLKFRTRRENR